MKIQLKTIRLDNLARVQYPGEIVIVSPKEGRSLIDSGLGILWREEEKQTKQKKRTNELNTRRKDK